jgi:hypothetical protein
MKTLHLKCLLSLVSITDAIPTLPHADNALSSAASQIGNREAIPIYLASAIWPKYRGKTYNRGKPLSLALCSSRSINAAIAMTSSFSATVCVCEIVDMLDALVFNR